MNEFLKKCSNWFNKEIFIIFDLRYFGKQNTQLSRLTDNYEKIKYI